MLPTAKELDPYGDLDGEEVVRQFLGLTREAAVDRFAKELYRYTESLMWMGQEALAYYLDAVFDYLKDDRSSGDRSVDDLELVLNFQLEAGKDPELVRKGATITDFVLTHWDKFHEIPGRRDAEDRASWTRLREKLANIRSAEGGGSTSSPGMDHPGP